MYITHRNLIAINKYIIWRIKTFDMLIFMCCMLNNKNNKFLEILDLDILKKS